MREDKLDFFIRRTEKDMDEIKEKLDKLWSFRLLLLGGSTALSIVVNTVFLWINFQKYKGSL